MNFQIINYGEDLTDHSRCVRVHSFTLLEHCESLEYTLNHWREIFDISKDKMAWYQITRVEQLPDGTYTVQVWGDKQPIKEVIKINVKKPTASGQYIKTTSVIKPDGLANWVQVEAMPIQNLINGGGA